MFKQLVSIFLVILLISPHLGAAQTYDMTRERYVHLTEKEKEKIIITIMQMMVEIESNYRTYTAVNGHDDDELNRTYSSIMKELRSFIMGEAYADDVRRGMEWNEYAGSFASSLEAVPGPAQPGDKCFFAGWVSRMKAERVVGTKQVNNICAHPKDLDPETAEFQAYKQSMKPRGCSPDKISCNPAIFGFKNIADNSVFCVFAKLPDPVKAGSTDSMADKSSEVEELVPEIVDPDSLFSTDLKQDSNNSSYNCMRLAMKLYKDKRPQGKKITDPALPEGQPDSPEQRLTFLKQKIIENPQYLTSILKFTSKTCICDNSEPSQLNLKYLKRIRPHRTCYGLMEMIGQTMKCVPDQLKVEHGIETKFFTDLQNYTNNTGITLGDVDGRYRNLMTKMRKSPEYGYYCLGEQRPQLPPPEIPKEYSCKDVVYADNECTVEALPDAPARSVSCNVFIYEKGHPDVNLMTEKITGLEGQAKEVEFSTGAGTEKEKVNCTLPTAPPIPTPEVTKTCSVELAASGKTLTATAKVGPQEIEILSYTWTPAAEGQASVTYPIGEQDIEVGLSIETKNGPLSCAPKKHEVAKPDDPSLDLELGTKTETKQKVIATVAGNFEGWKTQWLTRGEKSESDRSDRAPVAKDSESEEAPPETDESTMLELTDTKDEYTQNMDRKENEYQVCAYLIKGEKKLSEKCRPIKKLEAKEVPAKSEEKLEKVKKPKAAPPAPQMPMRPMIPRRTGHSHGGSL